MDRIGSINGLDILLYASYLYNITLFMYLSGFNNQTI